MFMQGDGLYESDVAYLVMTDDDWISGNLFFNLERFPQALIDADVRLSLALPQCWKLPDRLRIVLKDGTNLKYNALASQEPISSWIIVASDTKLISKNKE